MVNYAYTIRDKVSENELVMMQIANNSSEQAMLGDFPKAVDDAILTSGGGELHLAGITGNDIDHAGEIHGVDILWGGDDVEGGSGKGPDQRKRNTHREVEDVTH